MCKYVYVTLALRYIKFNMNICIWTFASRQFKKNILIYFY